MPFLALYLVCLCDMFLDDCNNTIDTECGCVSKVEQNKANQNAAAEQGVGRGGGRREEAREGRGE